MARRPAAVTQAEIARTIRAAQACGLPIAGVRPDGTVLIVGGKKLDDPAKEERSEWDEALGT